MLGAYIATLMKENVVKTGFEFVLIGVVGAVLSYLIGAWLKTFFSFG
jgi:VIT1/CCC1 family predicted Fe2+/Mn2+ transporter